MEKYPLAPLLKVREYREDAAKNALSAAERAVVEAQEAVERYREELERYKVWRQEEVERRYDAIMGSRGVSPSKGQEALGERKGNLSGETFFPSGFLKSADTEAIPLFPMPFASIMPCIFGN